MRVCIHCYLLDYKEKLRDILSNKDLDDNILNKYKVIEQRISEYFDYEVDVEDYNEDIPLEILDKQYIVGLKIALEIAYLELNELY